MARKNKYEAWTRRKRRVRKKITGSPERPRLSVYRSGRHIYAQIIDDTSGKTLAQASSIEKDFQEQVKGAEKSGMDKSKLEHFETLNDLALALQSKLTVGDAVLVKGSRFLKMEKIVAQFKDNDQHEF